jgi:hypothetical protein
MWTGPLASPLVARPLSLTLGVDEPPFADLDLEIPGEVAPPPTRGTAPQGQGRGRLQAEAKKENLMLALAP